MKENEQESEILQGYDNEKSYPFKQIFIFIFLIFAVILGGIYIGDALFGNRSFEVLQELQKEKKFLYKDVERLKNENAKLQKEFLEKNLLDPEMNK